MRHVFSLFLFCVFFAWLGAQDPEEDLTQLRQEVSAEVLEGAGATEDFTATDEQKKGRWSIRPASSRS